MRAQRPQSAHAVERQPHQSGHLPRLRALDLSGNRLARIPPCLPSSLEVLRLSANRVCEVPSWLARRLGATLTHLSVDTNNVIWLHPDVVCMPALRMLAMAQNPILRGRGQLAAALFSGADVADMRQIVACATVASWQAELASLRALDACGSTTIMNHAGSSGEA